MLTKTKIEAKTLVVPAVIARNPSIPWDRLCASDGMFDIGNIMVWVHDIQQTSVGRCRQFKVWSDTVSKRNQRAVPLATITTLGMPMTSYMRQISRNLSLWKLRTSSTKDARSNAVLMSLKPSRVFIDHRRVPLEVSNLQRAPALAQGMFPEGTLLERRIWAPTVFVEGRRRARPAWQGIKLFEGEIVRQFFDGASRRYSYQSVWSGGTSAERSLADLPDVIDEGVVERFMLDHR